MNSVGMNLMGTQIISKRLNGNDGYIAGVSKSHTLGIGMPYFDYTDI
jgi:hypothetical protein